MPLAIALVTLSHKMPAWVAAGYDEYARRLPRDYALELVELKPEPRRDDRTVAQVLAAEALRLAKACAGRRTIVLDERGSPWTTRELAGNLQQWRGEGTPVALVIGSADGLDAEFKRKAQARVALSALTLPHGLVRVLVAEQLYRAASIDAGHPYHRD